MPTPRASHIPRIATAVLAVSVLAGFTTTAEHGYGRRVAVCVGINHYAEHPDLACAVNDATAVARVLEDYGFDRVIRVRGAEATRRGILAALDTATAGIGPDDLLVVYFAGHGWTHHAGGTTTGYLLPADTRRGRESRDGIGMDVLRRYADVTPNRHSLFLVDACYAGLGIEAAARTTPSRRRVQVLTAGGELDRAFEADGHGLFTRHLLDYLQTVGAARGVATPDLACYVTAQVKNETAGWQAPRFGGHGRIIIAPN